MGLKPSNYLKHTSQNPMQKLLIQNFYKTLFTLIKPLKAKKVLDVGCGEGFTLKKLEEKRIGKSNEGIDYSKEAIVIGKKLYPTLKISTGNIYNLSYPDDSFDLILCTEVLEHLDNPGKAIEELKRVSHKYILFSVPNEPFFTIANFIRGKYLKTLGKHPEHINLWSFYGIERLIQQHGLKVVKKKYPFAWSVLLVKKQPTA